MTPNKVSAELRRIASAIQNSKNPSKELVLSDIRKVLASLKSAALPPHLQKQVERGDHPAHLMGDEMDFSGDARGPVLDPTPSLEKYMDPEMGADLEPALEAEGPSYVLPSRKRGDSEIASTPLEKCEDGCFKKFKVFSQEYAGSGDFVLFLNKGGQICCHMAPAKSFLSIEDNRCRPCSPRQLKLLRMLEAPGSRIGVLLEYGMALED